VHVHFGSLDFFVTMEGELARAPAPFNLFASLTLTQSSRPSRSCSCTPRRPAPLGVTNSLTSI
jgi:hypothetical protein